MSNDNSELPLRTVLAAALQNVQKDDAALVINLRDLKRFVVNQVTFFCENICENGTCKECELEQFRLWVSRTKPMEMFDCLKGEKVPVVRAGFGACLGPEEVNMVEAEGLSPLLGLAEVDSLIKAGEVHEKGKVLGLSASSSGVTDEEISGG